MLIRGEAGVGKTRLVDEFLNLAKKIGIRILKGWCLSEGVPPYFPFKEAFYSYMSTTDDAKAKSAMTKHLSISGWLKGPEVIRESKASEIFLAPEIERDRTFEGVARFLLQLSTMEPVILFLDDLHWADHLSLVLLHYLSRKCRNSRLLIIGTYRSEEIIPAKGERLHPLQETIYSMSREDLIIEMELSRLKRDDLPQLLKSIFRSSIEEEFEEKLYAETEGNPFFALETLNMLVDEGFISEKEGKWTLAAPTEELGIPSKVQETILRRIARLRRRERKLMDIAAVCGYSFSPDTLSRILALDIADVTRTLIEIEHRHRLISASADSTFDFTHQKIREVMYENLPGALRRVYHQKVASCLEQVLAEKISDGYLADIALHYIEGGVPERAFEYLVKLGENAVNIYANAQAIEHLSKALETIEKNVKLATDENLAKIYELRGRAWLRQEDFPTTKAREDFTLMLQRATNIRDETMIAEAHFWLGHAWSPYFGELVEARRHLETAREMAQKIGNKLLECRCLGRLGGALVDNLDTRDEGRMWLEESLRLCKETSDRVTETRNLQILARHYTWKGEFNRAKEYLNKAIALAEEIGGISVLVSILFRLTIVLAGSGEYDDAISTGQRCLQLARDSGLWAQTSWILNTLGWIYHDLSSIELASRHNSDSIEFARAYQRRFAWGGVPSALANLGDDCLSNNDYENAEKYFKEAGAMYHRHPGGWWRMESRLLLGHGEISLASGDYTLALKYARDSLDISEKADAKKYIAKGLRLNAKALAGMGNLREAIELMQNALKMAKKVGNPPLLWQIHHDLGNLLDEFGDSEKANEHHAEAIAIIETTASKLKDTSLKNALLTAPLTKAIRDAYSVRADRITTGCADVDNLLLGGIPKNYAVILTSPSCDERDLLITRFVEAGAREGQVTFHIVTNVTSEVKKLAEDFQSNFFLFICNPQADKIIRSLSNVFKLKGVENLNEINIALTSAVSKLDATPKGPRRVIIEITSDILLQHHAVHTRRWLTSLIPELKSKGFTTLAVIDPGMHNQQEVRAVLGVFEGEISIYEKKTEKGLGKLLRIKKLTNQKYLDSELLLEKENI